MEGWPQNWFKQFEDAAEDMEQFFSDLTKEVYRAAEAIAEFSDEVVEQMEAVLTQELDQFDQHLESWIEPVLQTFIGLDEAIEESVTPVTRMVDPVLNQHTACVGCRQYHGQMYGGNMLVCAMHPYGWDSEDCPDWESTWRE